MARPGGAGRLLGSCGCRRLAECLLSALGDAELSLALSLQGFPMSFPCFLARELSDFRTNTR